MSLIRATALSIPLADESVDLSLTSPPYFALRSYQDGGEHYDGQLGSEPTPEDFLRGQWAVADEVWRVLKPGGSAWWNYGDKYAGSGGHNSNLSSLRAKYGRTTTSDHERAASRRNAPDRYNQSADVRAKSLMGLPWRFLLGLICPERYREPIDPSWTCWHDDGPGPCITCRRKTLHPQWVGRAEVVWSKPNGLPESVTDRVRRSHEQWFHVTKSERYFAALDEIREPHAGPESASARRGPSGQNRGTATGRTHDDGRSVGNFKQDPLGKLPGSVWTIATEPLQVPDWLAVDHFAAFPQEWPRRIILGWSPSGYCTACGEPRRPVVEEDLVDVSTSTRSKLAKQGGRTRVNDGMASVGVAMEMGSTVATITGYACACPDTSAPTRPAVVLDPFGGTGTTAMVARALGRYPVHIDLSRDYLRLARWRIYDSGHWQKTIERTNRGPGGNVPELRAETDVLERPSLFDVEAS